MMLQLKQNWLGDFLNLLYPENCLACGCNLNKHEELICLLCEHNLPQTNFHLDKNNPVAKIFWGRVSLENVASFLFFLKKSRVQRLLHALKYKGGKEIGLKMGQLYGQILAQTPDYQNIDLIVPVPLHPLKQKRRGYNQSDWFAQGLSERMSVAWQTDALIRQAFTATQTRKSRLDRWKNVSTMFAVRDTNALRNKHVLLVDDVITTGATIEACAIQILELGGDTKVSVVSIACAAQIA